MKHLNNYIMFVAGCIIQLLTLFYDVGDSTFNIAIAPIALGALALGGGAALNSWANSQNRENAEYSLEMQKRLMNYEWQNFNSPKAQAKSLAEIGLNPAVAFGQGGVRGVAPSSTAPELAQSDIGLSGQDFANTILALSQAKKAGSEEAGVNLDNLLKGGTLSESINSVVLDNAAKRFELELNKWFAAPEKVANITLAWKNAVLKDDEHSINEFRKLFEQYSADLKGIERDSAQKVYENMDTVIEQQNRQREEDIKLTQEKQKTEGTQQTANRAAAKASQSQATLNEHQQQLIDYQSEFQDMVNKVKRSNLSSEMLTELKKILANRALSEAEQKEAQLRIQHVEAFINARNNSAAWREFDNACNWISSKISASISGSFSSVSKD